MNNIIETMSEFIIESTDDPIGPFVFAPLCDFCAVLWGLEGHVPARVDKSRVFSLRYSKRNTALTDHVHAFERIARDKDGKPLVVCIPGRYVSYFMAKMLPRITNDISVLFVARDDFDVTDMSINAAIRCKRIHRIVCHHLHINHEKVAFLPLGIGSSSWWSRADYARSTLPPHERLLYVNFSVYTNPSRIHKAKALEANGFSMSPMVSRDVFLQRLSQSSFCASPDGHAKDCFRTWEAMHARCTPLVDNWPALRSRAPWLPVVWILPVGESDHYDDGALCIQGGWEAVTVSSLSALCDAASERMRVAGRAFLSSQTWFCALSLLCARSFDTKTPHPIDIVAPK